MDKQIVTLSHPITKSFVELIQAHESTARAYANGIVKRNQLLQSPDEEDIYALGMTKIWHAYFRDNTAQQYYYRSTVHEFSLIKAALRTAALDVIKRRAKEAEILSHIELDEPAPAHIDRAEACSTSDFTDWINLGIDLEAFINKVCKQPGHRLVVLYLVGLADRDDLAAYSDTYIRVTAHRLKKQIQHYLEPPKPDITNP
jgi:hypothetical protein